MKVIVKLFISVALLLLVACNDDHPQINNTLASRSNVVENDDSVIERTIQIYYHGRLTPIEIDESKRFVLIQPNSDFLARTASQNEGDTYIGKIVNWNSESESCEISSKERIISVDYVTTNGTPITNTFSIRLKRESDLKRLQAIVESINCRIIGRMETNPLWIDIWCDTSAPFKTSVEAANYVFEHGDFLDVDHHFGLTEKNYLASFTGIPNDPLYNMQWNLHGTYGINVRDAWKYTIGSPEVIIAVVDQYVNVNHTDLAGQFTEFKVISSSNILNDLEQHGTKVASFLTKYEIGIRYV